TSFSARATNEKPRHQSGLLRGILRRPARRKRTAMMQEHIARCIQRARVRRREDSDEEEDYGDVEDSDEEAERDKDAVREMHEAARG
ncbi:unnamed protein product, partial [Ectocarpus sp. 12 AP-2014]